MILISNHFLLQNQRANKLIKGVRNYFHRTFDATLPILGISEGEASGFLAQIDLREFASYVNVLKKQKIKLQCLPM